MRTRELVSKNRAAHFVYTTRPQQGYHTQLYQHSHLTTHLLTIPHHNKHITQPTDTELGGLVEIHPMATGADWDTLVTPRSSQPLSYNEGGRDPWSPCTSSPWIRSPEPLTTWKPLLPGFLEIERESSGVWYFLMVPLLRSPLAPNYMHQLRITRDLASSGASGPLSSLWLLLDTSIIHQTFPIEVMYTLSPCSTTFEPRNRLVHDFIEIGFPTPLLDPPRWPFLWTFLRYFCTNQSSRSPRT